MAALGGGYDARLAVCAVVFRREVRDDGVCGVVLGQPAKMGRSSVR